MFCSFAAKKHTALYEILSGNITDVFLLQKASGTIEHSAHSAVAMFFVSSQFQATLEVVESAVNLASVSGMRNARSSAEHAQSLQRQKGFSHWCRCGSFLTPASRNLDAGVKSFSHWGCVKHFAAPKYNF